MKIILNGIFYFLDCSEIGGIKIYLRDYEGMIWKELIYFEIFFKVLVSLLIVIENCCVKMWRIFFNVLVFIIRDKEMNFIVFCVIIVDF